MSTPTSSSGKPIPQSTTKRRPADSRAKQFIPISPRPPSGMKRTKFAVTVQCIPRKWPALQGRGSLPAVSDIDNEELERLLSEGVPYVDVRTNSEFEGGHIPGALNVPVVFPGKTPGSWSPNAEFLPEFERRFAKSQPVAIGCASGVRSRHACALLTQIGYTQIYHLAGGMFGGRDAFGAKLPGWQEVGKPVSSAGELSPDDLEAARAKGPGP
jgi:arsenate reductase